MSDYWNITIPFKGTRARAKEIAEDVHGAMMWSEGVSWPYDSDHPCTIRSVDELSIETLQARNKELEEFFAEMNGYIGVEKRFPSEFWIRRDALLNQQGESDG